MGREAKFPTTGDSCAREPRAGPEDPRVLVTSEVAGCAAARSQIAPPILEKMCWGETGERPFEVLHLVEAPVYAMLGQQLFLLGL